MFTRDIVSYFIQIKHVEVKITLRTIYILLLSLKKIVLIIGLNRHL